MKKWLQGFLRQYAPLNAWQREEITDTVEAMYQAKRREIIIQTVIITTVIVGILAAFVVAYLKDIYALLG